MVGKENPPPPVTSSGWLGAAKRLTTGTAAGIDIWQTQDLSGNRPDAVLENARREGVADRVTIATADMRQIPFPDGHFDVIVSKEAIHNLYHANERAAVVREIARVLKPGGACILADVRHEAEYATVLRASGLTDVHRHDSHFTSFLRGYHSGQREAVRAGWTQTVGVSVKTTANRQN